MSYDANSIQQLTFRQGVRKRIGIYLGSADHTGVIAGLLELVNNATDEALVCPTAKKIELVIGKDWASCRDYGRGMPHGENNFSKEVMINLLTENHSGAKFDENAYGGKSRGLNGTGSAATCCSSDIFKISSYRDGAEWYMEFEEGIPKFDICQKKPLGKNKGGTYIWYKPSQEVFNAEPINFDYKEICSIIEEYSYFNKGIVFEVKNGENEEVKTFCSKRGLIDFAETKIKNPIHKTPLIFSTTEDDIDIEIIAQWTKGKEKFYLFSNGGENPNGGTPITGIKSSITAFIKKHLADFDGDMARTGLVYICSVNLKNPIYDGQTKSKITNPELRGLAQRSMTQMLNDFKIKNPNEFNQIIGYLEKLAKATAAAEKAHDAILNYERKELEQKKKKIAMPDKFKDCEKHGEDSMLIICEGNSALAGLMPARDVNTEALYAVRGKVKNLMKHPLDECLENQEVSDIILALGCGIQKKYNPKKLNYGKVAIAVDADVDGKSIMCLIATMFWVLMPDFIKEGRLCWLQAPLYKLEKGNKRVFAYNNEELKKLRVGREDWVQTRAKGLGELRAEDMEESMMHKTNRHLEILKISDIIGAEESLKMLMGTDVEGRREFLFENVDFSKLNG